MLQRLLASVLPLALLSTLSAHTPAQTSATPASASFKTVVYIPVFVTNKMADHKWLESSWAQISSQVHVDKVYIETYRSRVLADDGTIDDVKKFFLDHGVEVAGGICYSDRDNGQFASFTYTKQEDREYIKHITGLAARHFDELILDDFYFANTKTPSDIAAKGDKSWTDFRLQLMDQASRELVVGAAKAANPKIKVVIKFPNWYEHFAANGYDLQEEPKIFDGIYAGTETRDPVETDQNLQQYEGFNIINYFEHVDPGHMGGGWVDTYDLRYIDRYSEQLWLTVFAKAKEMTLFNYIDLLNPAPAGDRPWASQATDVQMQHLLDRSHGQPVFATVAGDALDQVKPVIPQLGTPIGIASYRPYHAVGEDFLHNFLGMVGIPIDLYPTFPADKPVVLLTEAAAADPKIIGEMKQQLQAGKTVVITSGLFHAMQGKGIEDLIELRYNPAPVSVDSFIGAFGPGAGTGLGDAEKPFLIPRLQFSTNDAWPVIRAIGDNNAFPLLLMDQYAKGRLYILSVPDNFADLYQLPQPALDALRSYVMGDFPVRIDAPAKVSLFPYDNGSFIVESFRDAPVQVTVHTATSVARLKNMQTGVEVAAAPQTTHQRSALGPMDLPSNTFSITLPPHSYMAFQAR